MGPVQRLIFTLFYCSILSSLFVTLAHLATTVTEWDAIRKAHSCGPVCAY